MDVITENPGEGKPVVSLNDEEAMTISVVAIFKKVPYKTLIYH